MKGQTQARPAARSARRRPVVGAWLVAGFVVEVALAVVDIVSSNDVVFTTTFVLVPFALAILGHWKTTAVAGVLAVVLSIASGFWDSYAGSEDHVLRVTMVLTGSALAVGASWALGRAAEERRRMSVLAAVGRLTGAETLEAAVRGLNEALVPAVADRCWVDVLEPDGTMRGLWARTGGGRTLGEPARAGRVARAGPARAARAARARRPASPASPRRAGRPGRPARPGRAGRPGRPARPRRPARARHARGGRRAPRTPPRTGRARLTRPRARRRRRARARAAAPAYDADDLAFFAILAGRVSLVLANARL